MKTMKLLTSCSIALLLACAASVSACKTEDASRAVVANESDAVVYRAWWFATYFADPIAPAETSEEERVVPATDTVYALLAPGWDPLSGAPPTTLIALKSKATSSVKRGDLLTIRISNETFAGNCAAPGAQLLSQEEADVITQRIFPSDFAGFTYDAKTCTLTPVAADAAVDAGGADADATD